MTLNIVLVEPQIPQNTGNVARTCAATGARLHLVGPMGFAIEDSKLKRAGLDYWHLLDISYYENIAAFFSEVSGGALSPAGGAKCTACSALDSAGGALSPEAGAPDTSGFEFYYFTTKAGRVYTEPNYADNSYIFFGSETKGLDETLLYRNPGQCVRFPMQDGARSLNLSNAVAVGGFEVLRQWGFPGLQNYGKMAGESG